MRWRLVISRLDVMVGDAAAVLQDFRQSRKICAHAKGPRRFRSADSCIPAAHATASSFPGVPGCEGCGRRRQIRRRRDDHAAFAGGDLLVGIEGEDRRAARTTPRNAGRSSPRNPRRNPRSAAIRVSGQAVQARSSPRDCRMLPPRRWPRVAGVIAAAAFSTRVQGFGVDVGKDRRGATYRMQLAEATKENGVVITWWSGADPGGDHGRMKPGGSRRKPRSPASSGDLGAELLEFFQFRSDGKCRGFQHIDHRVDFNASDVGTR